MLVGPTDVGKSSVAKILLNYSVRQGHQPTFVDVDIGQGSLAVPGSVAAALVDRPIDPEEGFSSLVPLTYFYGHASPSDNPVLYKRMVNRLAETVTQRLNSERHGKYEREIEENMSDQEHS